MIETFPSHGEADTLALGRKLASLLRGGEVLALSGDLGAGKTHLCKGLVAGLGHEGEVTSPTFALVQEYRSGRLPVFHFDWYRIEHPAELIQLGWDEYLDEGGIVLVEWAEKFPDLLPADAWQLDLRIDGETDRVLTLRRP